MADKGLILLLHPYPSPFFIDRIPKKLPMVPGKMSRRRCLDGEYCSLEEQLRCLLFAQPPHRSVMDDSGASAGGLFGMPRGGVERGVEELGGEEQRMEDRGLAGSSTCQQARTQLLNEPYRVQWLVQCQALSCMEVEEEVRKEVEGGMRG
ncbi:hypothetical protein OsI_37827 [Oryza sativa Indica Group]|uniref:Uncharacterized protein n=1 Tax=Oryza sativa subsp. indica TaxID=39946 RepID=A2ZJ24_ORYSI|nr:hypothetical protein OsI_37827 [Oryza sativa Indica Group]